MAANSRRQEGEMKGESENELSQGVLGHSSVALASWRTWNLALKSMHYLSNKFQVRNRVWATWISKVQWAIACRPEAQRLVVVMEGKVGMSVADLVRRLWNFSLL